jgi:hypothetical protein
LNILPEKEKVRVSIARIIVPGKRPNLRELPNDISGGAIVAYVVFGVSIGRGAKDGLTRASSDRAANFFGVLPNNLSPMGVLWVAWIIVGYRQSRFRVYFDKD